MLTKEPRALKVGPYTYRCRLAIKKELKEKGSVKEGETWFMGLTILVRQGMAPERERETFLHEIMHAVWDCAGVIPALTAEHTEEGTIRPMSTGLYAVLLDNPWVVDYLFGEPA